MIKKADIEIRIIKSAIAFIVFAVYTILVMLVDVQPIGPNKTTVGFATINRYFINLFGVHAIYYRITDYLAILSILVVVFFAGVGAYQLIKRRSFRAVDSEIYALAVFYIAIVAFYALFEVAIINYRPVLVDGVLEASYPSSHTMLVVSVVSAAMMEAHRMLKNKPAAETPVIILGFMILLLAIFGRLFAGVHWFTDILGSLFLTAYLLSFFRTTTVIIKKIKDK